jgi:glycosyltransferase involved in cell wall biosynthesis
MNVVQDEQVGQERSEAQLNALRVAVIIPAYNEAQVIGDVINCVRQQFDASELSYELVVVNDNSTDDTSQVAKQAGATVINHILNRGAGGATSTGLRYANSNNFDLAVTMDADGQHLPQDVLSCVRELLSEQVDLLIGSRLMNTSGMSFVKVLGNRGLSLVTLLLYGIKVIDSQSGLRAFSKRALQVLRWKSSGYEFCSEMILRAKQQRLKITEHPISAIYTEYSRSKGQSNWNGINIVRKLISQRILEITQ